MIGTIHHLGYFGVFITLFLEIGFMIFPLPGDTLLFTTGIITESGKMSYQVLLAVAIFSSFISGQLGYFIGSKIDRETLMHNKIYKIKPAHLHKTEAFFYKYGFYAILFSRFVPIVRSFISQLMGIIQYDEKKFFLANLGASIIWPFTIISLGYLLGQIFPNLIRFAEYGMLAVLLILAYPILHEFYKSRK